MRTLVCIGSVLLFGLAWLQAADMKVSALHPLMADLARQVGGDRVEVYDLVGEGGNPHRFEPRPADLLKMKSSALVLAAGKGMESYLDRLKAALEDVPIMDVGRTIPSLTVGKDAVYTCCPDHGHRLVDPHWWHGIGNMRRAAREIAEVLGELDPAGAKIYGANARDYGKRLDGLKSWAKRELARVPRGQRKLVTAHNAFGYFANEFGFEVIAVAGLTQEQDTTPQDRAKTIESVRSSGVKGIFPEKGLSARPLESVARATGAQIGKALISDGNGTGESAGFEGMIRHNVGAIVEVLAKP